MNATEKSRVYGLNQSDLNEASEHMYHVLKSITEIIDSDTRLIFNNRMQWLHSAKMALDMANGKFKK